MFLSAHTKSRLGITVVYRKLFLVFFIFWWGLLSLCLASSRNMRVIKFTHETSMTLKLNGKQRSLCVVRVWG